MGRKWDERVAALHPTRALADLVAETTYDDLPPNIVHETKRLVLDVLACAVGGSITDIGRIAISLSRYLGGNRQATVIGTGDKTSCVSAAHTNCRLGSAIDADDTFLSTTHHGTPTVCAALGVGEAEHISGKALIS